eukprot:TRINITY_DN1443_c0_g1_i2.p1 TRINITY_DN1443_c0_g1~~TRINITY_DN1443_c0_g1_i2.p1  ORF type:complete len:144 (-),score=9.62 TRINITY_DN1443_c0_g1_i2:175-606(-)
MFLTMHFLLKLSEVIMLIFLLPLTCPYFTYDPVYKLKSLHICLSPATFDQDGSGMSVSEAEECSDVEYPVESIQSTSNSCAAFSDSTKAHISRHVDTNEVSYTNHSSITLTNEEVQVEKSKRSLRSSWSLKKNTSSVGRTAAD